MSISTPKMASETQNRLDNQARDMVRRSAYPAGPRAGPIKMISTPAARQMMPENLFTVNNLEKDTSGQMDDQYMDSNRAGYVEMRTGYEPAVNTDVSYTISTSPPSYEEYRRSLLAQNQGQAQDPSYAQYGGGNSGFTAPQQSDVHARSAAPDGGVQGYLASTLSPRSRMEAQAQQVMPEVPSQPWAPQQDAGFT